MSKVRMRFPLWEGSWVSGIPSPVTTFLYVGLVVLTNTDRKIPRDETEHILLEAFLLKLNIQEICLSFSAVLIFSAELLIQIL